MTKTETTKKIKSIVKNTEQVFKDFISFDVPSGQLNTKSGTIDLINANNELIQMTSKEVLNINGLLFKFKINYLNITSEYHVIPEMVTIKEKVKLNLPVYVLEKKLKQIEGLGKKLEIKLNK